MTNLLAGKGSSQEYGVRPLYRAIVSLVEDLAADLMLARHMKKVDTLCVSVQEDQVQVRLVRKKRIPALRAGEGTFY